MKIVDHLSRLLVAGLLLGGAWIVVSNIIGNTSGPLIVDVKIPQLSIQAVKGKDAFDENCIQCHGENASGSEAGPPLVHGTYNPGHHGDEAFMMAVERGSRRHHWSFGDMPAQPQVTKRQIVDITRYIRELQAVNGIVSSQHTM